MSDSLVSIIIPAFNREDVISETLQSVLNQSYKNWECIIVDDGSTDNTIDIIKSFSELDSRFKLHVRPNNLIKGGNTCRNLGFNLSKGEYIQWLDSDDLIAEDKIKLQVEALKSSIKNSVAICKFGYFTNAKNLDVRENIKTYRNYKKGIQLLKAFGKYSEYFPPHVFLTKRDVVEKAGLWNEDLLINQDGEFFARILLNASNVKFVNTVVYYRHTSTDNVSLLNSSKKAKDLIYSWKLIEKHIHNVSGKYNHIYVENAKRVIYKQIKECFPEIINENVSFFKPTIKPLFKRIFNKK